nr:MAG TPA: hypothetical protein [Caudoviricetes sp.]
MASSKCSSFFYLIQKRLLDVLTVVSVRWLLQSLRTFRCL